MKLGHPPYEKWSVPKPYVKVSLHKALYCYFKSKIGSHFQPQVQVHFFSKSGLFHNPGANEFVKSFASQRFLPPFFYLILT